MQKGDPMELNFEGLEWKNEIDQDWMSHWSHSSSYHLTLRFMVITMSKMAQCFYFLLFLCAGFRVTVHETLRLEI